MAWSPSYPWTALQSTDMPSGPVSQASLFATIGAWINNLGSNQPVTAAGSVTIAVPALNTPYSQTVSFPASRFGTTTPIVQATITNGVTNPQAAQVTVGGKSPTGCTIYVTRSSSAGNSVTIDWSAEVSS